MKARLVDLGDAALTLEFGEEIDSGLNDQVMAARDALLAAPPSGITDVVPAYASLTVHFDPLRADRDLVATALREAAATGKAVESTARQWWLPVHFGGESGPDLAEAAAATGRSEAEIVTALCDVELRVFLIGFLPGFPYMGLLPEWLSLPRRATPRTAVPANSVAIAGRQAAVYPWQSPGGWHLLGRTPVPLFDLRAGDRPSLLAAGDRVRFRAVDASEFNRLEAGIAQGNLDRYRWLTP